MKTQNKKAIWASFILTGIIFLFTIILFNITYELNDDVMIENILSGSYTGSPEYMTFYFSVPLSFVVSLLYRIIPVFPWHGILFVLSYMTAFGLISFRVFDITLNLSIKRKSAFAYMLSMLCLVFIFIFLKNVILLHYTVLSAVMGATGLFLFITSNKETYSYKQDIVPIILMLYSYLIREKVFFMILPFFMVTVFYRLIKWGISQLKQCIKPLIIFAVSFVIIFVLNKIPYMNDEWQAYLKYNDARTTLYDYVGIYTTDRAKDYYYSKGITEDTYDLYRSYNLMLTDKNEDLINTFSSYQNEKIANRTFVMHFKDALYVYRESLLKNKDYIPLNPVIFALYLISFAIILAKKKYKDILVLLSLFFVRSGMWLYLIWNDRYPVRVTYSLLYIEIFILLGLLTDYVKGNQKLLLTNLFSSIAVLAMLSGAYFSLPNAISNYNDKVVSNKEDDILYEYIEEHKDNFFIVDVFATVNRTTKALQTRNSNNQNNYIVPGGWMVESPLTAKKLNAYKASSLKELIDNNSSVRIVLKKDMYNNITIDNYTRWLNLDFELIETLNGETETFYIYTVKKAD